MQIIIAILLLIIGVGLFLAKTTIGNEGLERAANVSSIIATIAGILILAFYTASLGSRVAPATVTPSNIPTFPTLTLATTPLTPASTPTLDSLVFVVPALGTGYSTQLLVHQGDVLVFFASGIWCWGDVVDCSSADGTPGRPNPDEGRPLLPDHYYGTLIGRVGDWIFPIGISSEVVMQKDGELVLFMNDSSPYDNTGEISVKVSRK